MTCSYLGRQGIRQRASAKMLSVVLLGSPLPVGSQEAEKLRQEPSSQPATQGQPQAEPARSLTIDHKQVGCVVAERFPVISARVDPAASVGRARVYFRAAGGPHWPC